MPERVLAEYLMEPKIDPLPVKGRIVGNEAKAPVPSEAIEPIRE